MSIRGNLETMELSGLLQWLDQGRKTGTLVLKNGRDEKRLVFDEGALISTFSTNPHEHICRFLLDRNLVERDRLRCALSENRGNSLQLGRALVDAGELTDETLTEMLETRAKEIVRGLFGWATGDFQFLDGELPPSLPVTISLDVTAILLHMADAMERMEEALTASSEGPPAPTGVDPAPSEPVQPAEFQPMAMEFQPMEGQSVSEPVSHGQLAIARENVEIPEAIPEAESLPDVQWVPVGVDREEVDEAATNRETGGALEGATQESEEALSPEEPAAEVFAAPVDAVDVRSEGVEALGEPFTTEPQVVTGAPAPAFPAVAAVKELPAAELPAEPGTEAPAERVVEPGVEPAAEAAARGPKGAFIAAAVAILAVGAVVFFFLTQRSEDPRTAGADSPPTVVESADPSREVAELEAQLAALQGQLDLLIEETAASVETSLRQGYQSEVRALEAQLSSARAAREQADQEQAERQVAQQAAQGVSQQQLTSMADEALGSPASVAAVDGGSGPRAAGEGVGGVSPGETLAANGGPGNSDPSVLARSDLPGAAKVPAEVPATRFVALESGAAEQRTRQPAVELASQTVVRSIPLLSDSQPSSAQAVPPGAGSSPSTPFVAPRIVRQPRAKYPALARRMGREASVEVEVLVGKDGTAVESRIAGAEVGLGFESAALAAVRGARWEPAQVNGELAEVWTLVRIDFRSGN